MDSCRIFVYGTIQLSNSWPREYDNCRTLIQENRITVTFVACEATFLKTWCAIIVSNKSVRELYWSPKEVLHRSVWECIWWISEISELVWMDWREGSNMENSQRMCRKLYDFTLRTKSIIGEAYLWNLNKKYCFYEDFHYVFLS